MGELPKTMGELSTFVAAEVITMMEMISEAAEANRAGKRYNEHVQDACLRAAMQGQKIISDMTDAMEQKLGAAATDAD